MSDNFPFHRTLCSSPSACSECDRLAAIAKADEPIAWIDPVADEAVTASRRATWPAHNQARYTVPAYVGATLSHPANQAGALQAALAVDCPHCWQKAGQPCIWPETRTSNRNAPHDARKAAALAATQPNAQRTQSINDYADGLEGLTAEARKLNGLMLAVWACAKPQPDVPAEKLRDLLSQCLPHIRKAALERASAERAPNAAPAPRFSCHLQRDYGNAPCASDCGKLRCMYPSAPNAAFGKGWQLVPVEPTPEMIAAAGNTAGMRAIDSAASMHQLRGNPLPASAFADGSPLHQAYRAMLIAAAREQTILTGAEIDTLVALVERGPLSDGDVPSKSGRDGLVERGLAARVLVHGQDGYQAATYAGRDAYQGRYGAAQSTEEATANRITTKAIRTARKDSE